MYLSDFVKYDENEENVFLVFVEREKEERERVIYFLKNVHMCV